MIIWFRCELSTITCIHAGVDVFKWQAYTQSKNQTYTYRHIVGAILFIWV